MVFQSSVLYPNENINFKMDYYLSSHMPLVGKLFKQHGLQKYEVIQFGPGPDGSEPKYAVKATLAFGSKDQAKTAFTSAEAKEVFADIPNFSNVQPVLLVGDMLASEAV